MRKMLVIAAVAMSLGGCATTGGGQTPADIIAQIQQATTQACGFLPTASTVAAIVAAATGTSAAITGVVAIASAICAQVVTNKSLRRGAPTVNGVVIQGQFVR